MMSNCPCCGKGKGYRKYYLCGACWRGLSETTRRRLWKKDDLASLRMYELYEQIGNEVPLSEIQVSA